MPPDFKKLFFIFALYFSTPPATHPTLPGLFLKRNHEWYSIQVKGPPPPSSRFLLDTLSSALHPDQLLNCRWLESKPLFYTSVYTWSLKNNKCLWTQKIVLIYEKHGYLYCSRGAGCGRAFVIYQSHTFVRAIYSQFVNSDSYRVEATIHIPSYLLQISTPQRLSQRASLILHGLLHKILVWPSVTILMCVHMCV